MSKERARRRAERTAVVERERARRARSVARRERRRALVRRLTPRIRRGRTGRIGGRTRAERVGIAVVTIGALVLIWTMIDNLALRLVLVTLLLLALPAAVVLVLGRRT